MVREEEECSHALLARRVNVPVSKHHLREGNVSGELVATKRTSWQRQHSPPRDGMPSTVHDQLSPHLEIEK